MKCTFVFCVLFIVLLPKTADAQPRCPGSTPHWGLNCFLGSEFMKNFEEARAKSEQSIRDFESLHRRFKYSEDDYQMVLDAYNASANEFNKVLMSVTEDMMNKQIRKQITGQPQSYALLVNERLERAKDFYANHYVSEVARVTEGKITGSTFLTALPTIIKAAEQAFLIFNKLRSEFNKYNYEMLMSKMVEPNRFKSFQEVR